MAQEPDHAIDLPDSICIRQVTRKDLPALEWDGEYTHFRRLYAQAYRRARRGEAVLWLAEIPTKGVIGQLFVQLISQRAEIADGNTRAYIFSFRVRLPYRSLGVGTKLLETAEVDLRRRGFQRVTLNVARDNPAARRLYERMGYQVVGKEAGIWSYIDHRGKRQQVNEPSWRMEKVLSGT